LQHNYSGLTDGSPYTLAKYWDPGPHYCCTLHVATEHRHVRQDFSLTLLQRSTNECPLSSHSEALFEAPFVGFCVTTFRQNFLRRHLKEKGMFKILAACHSGAPFQLGALRTCVPCLMVNPALISKNFSSSLTICIALEIFMRMRYINWHISYLLTSNFIQSWEVQGHAAPITGFRASDRNHIGLVIQIYTFTAVHGWMQCSSGYKINQQ